MVMEGNYDYDECEIMMVIGDGGGDMIMVIEANYDDNGDGDETYDDDGDEGKIMMEMTEK